MKTLLIALAFFALAVPAAAWQQAKPILPPLLQGIGIDQHLNAQLPLATEFRDEDGRTVRLGTFFGKRPVLLALVYYTCPMLCNQILTGAAAALRPLSLRPGRDFDVVAISINPSETPADAAAKRDFVARRYAGKPDTTGFHFLVGDPDAIHAVANAAGFHYRYDAASKMFLHASGVMAVTPQGRMARYFYGVDYAPKDLKLGLIEASHNTIGSLTDQILLFCYHYDPKTGKYGAVVIDSLRGAAIAALVILALALTLLWRSDLRRYRPIFKEVRHP